MTDFRTTSTPGLTGTGRPAAGTDVEPRQVPIAHGVVGVHDVPPGRMNWAKGTPEYEAQERNLAAWHAARGLDYTTPAGAGSPVEAETHAPAIAHGVGSAPAARGPNAPAPSDVADVADVPAPLAE